MQSDRLDFAQSVGRGDACRASQRWADAASHYERAVQLRSLDAGIWVQLGHARKESGAFVQAEVAYRRAYALTPGDAEILLQLGHLQALRDHPKQAAALYRQAVDAGSHDDHARRYIARFGDFGAPSIPETPVALPAIYFEYTDLLNHFRNSRNPTGIQRVQIELFRASLAEGTTVPICACAYVDRIAAWVTLDTADLLKLVNLASAPGDLTDLEWHQATKSFFADVGQRVACEFPVGAALVNLGSSWGLHEYMPAIRLMKARYGLRYIPFIHDLIPLLTPEFVVSGLAVAFNAWFSSALLHADLFVATSRSTCDDVVNAAKTVRALTTRPVAMALDVSPVSAKTTTVSRAAEALHRFGLTNQKFVMFVGTMEIRKNHQLVFQAWVRLLQQYGSEEIPVLVCVGKRGWKFDQAQALLDSHAELERHVLQLSSISDTELELLYQGCLFTVYASLYEGWGLPVTESLCHGKVCLTADHSSLPEAGGRFADYYEANSLRNFVERAERLIHDADYRLARERLIAAEFRPRTWHQALSGLVNAIVASFPHVAMPAQALAPIALGTVYLFGYRLFDRRLNGDAAIAEMLRSDAGGWHEMSEHTLYSRVQHALIVSRLPAMLDEGLLIFLMLRAPPEPIALTIHCAGVLVGSLSLAANETRVIRLDIPERLTADNAAFALQISVDHLTNMAVYNVVDQRHVGVGLEMLMICNPTDIAARLTVLERAFMTLEDA